MSSPTFDTLPYELKLDIVELLYDVSGHKVPHVMADNAAWAKPYYHLGQDDEDRHYQRGKADESLDCELETPLENPPTSIQTSEGWRSPLKALRL